MKGMEKVGYTLHGKKPKCSERVEGLMGEGKVGGRDCQRIKAC